MGVAAVVCAWVKQRMEDNLPKVVVFLDIDGVLNRTKAAKQIKLEEDLVGKLGRAVRRANKILETTNTTVDIVLTTFWRHHKDYIQYILGRHHVNSQVIGSTPGAVAQATTLKNALSHPHYDGPHSPFRTRADELRQWISDYGQRLESFVILDDRSDAADGELLEHFVQTSSAAGLTDGDCDRCVQILTAAAVQRRPDGAAVMADHGFSDNNFWRVEVPDIDLDSPTSDPP